MTRTLKPLILNTSALTLTLILIYTGISAHDKLTWLMEVTPVIIVVQLLATARRYPLTPLLYTLIFLHAIILMVGGQYTYAKVPVGFEVQEWLGLSKLNGRTSWGTFSRGWCLHWWHEKFSFAGCTYTDVKWWRSWSAAWRWR